MKKQKTETAVCQEKRILIYCMRCGSTDVTRDASAKWNVNTQEWEITGVHDGSICQECGIGETLGIAPLSPL